MMQGTASIKKTHPEFHFNAFLLQADPSPTRDEVKCRLMPSARPAVDNTARIGKTGYLTIANIC